MKDVLVNLFFSKTGDGEDIKQSLEVIHSLIDFAIITKFFDLWGLFLQGGMMALGLLTESANHNIIAYWVINMFLCWFFVLYLQVGYIGLWYSIITG